MAFPLTSLFDNRFDLEDTRGESLIYLALPKDMDFFDRVCDATLNETLLDLFANYHCYKITAGTPEYAAFVQQYPLSSAPSFNIVSHKVQRIFSAEDAPEQFLAFLQQKEADNDPNCTKENLSKIMGKSGDNGVGKKEPRVVLSIRLLTGETVQGSFDPNTTLKAVGRWLESEHGVLLTSGKENSQNYNSGLPDPLRYAFFCPGTRVTFCEGQEFCQLKSLGLSPRLALILKPEYDVRALEAHANYSTLAAARSKFAAMLLALYSFFDYGVDDAQRDFQSMTMDDVPIAVPGFLPMDAAGMANTTIGPTLSAMDGKGEQNSEYLAEVVSREGTPAPGMLDALA